jgi:hypothetical protein
MKVVPAPGSKDMQDALNDKYVKKAVDLLLEIYVTNNAYFRRVAFFLKNNYQAGSPQFLEKLQALRSNAQPHLDARVPEYIDKLIDTLEHIYERDQRTLDYRRGAVVELFAGKIVRERCEPGEYFSNHCFVESLYGYGYSSKQIDVVMFSERRRQVEAYSCKINPRRVNKEAWESSCSDLVDLVSYGEEKGYVVHVGTVCFENSNVIISRLEDLPQTEIIHAIGVDNMHVLQHSPFEIY